MKITVINLRDCIHFGSSGFNITKAHQTLENLRSMFQRAIQSNVKSSIVVLFLILAFTAFSSKTGAQTVKNIETVDWKYETETYGLEMALKLIAGKVQSYYINAFRLTPHNDSMHECDTSVERGKDNSVWSEKGLVTHITGENDLGSPIDITIEKRKNGFFVKSSLCGNVGIPDVLLTRKGKTYLGRIIR